MHCSKYLIDRTIVTTVLCLWVLLLTVILGKLTVKLQKINVGLLFMPAYPFICPHESAWFPLDGFFEVSYVGFLLQLFYTFWFWWKLYTSGRHFALWNLTAVGLCDWDRLCCLWGMSWGQRNGWSECNNWEWLIPNLPLYLVLIFIKCHLWLIINLWLR